MITYVLLFLAYIKIKKRQKTVDKDTYVMTKNKILPMGIAILNWLSVLSPSSALHIRVMDTVKDNIVYDEMIWPGGYWLSFQGFIFGDV